MAYSSPYLTSAPDINLYTQLLDRAREQKETLKATTAQKGKLVSQFEAQIKRAEKEAKRKAKKGSGLFKAINFIGAMFGPVGAAITAGITGLAQGEQQKQAMKTLLDKPAYERFGKTFMREDVKDIEKSMQKRQVSTSDVIKKAAIQSATSYLASKAFDTGEIFKIGPKAATTTTQQALPFFAKQHVAAGVASAPVSGVLPGTASKVIEQGHKALLSQMDYRKWTPFENLLSNLKSSFDPKKIAERSVDPLEGVLGLGEGKFADWGGMQGIETILQGLKMFGGEGDIGAFIESTKGQLESSDDKKSLQTIQDLIQGKNKLETSDYDDFLRMILDR